LPTAMSAPPLTLPVGVTENTVRVHPVVLFTICDAYIRRSENQDRVIGTLLGTISDGVVEIRDCYAVPHSESNDQVRISLTLSAAALCMCTSIAPVHYSLESLFFLPCR
jgi:hypothetical protein